MNMTADDICVEDIAHALSLLCRGNGHLKYFYSVGQHSLNCAREAKARGWSERLQLICLLHDASEAYISDIIRPVKTHLTNYLSIEQMVMDCVFKKFNLFELSEDENIKWKQVDDDILTYELKVLMNGKEESELPILFSEPDVSEKDWVNVQAEFLKVINALTSL